MKFINCSDRRKAALILTSILSLCFPAQAQIRFPLPTDSLTKGVLISPAITWNENDHWMPGVYVTNRLAEPQFFTFQLLPQYSTDTKTLVGAGKISINSYPEKQSLSAVSVFLQGKSYHLPAYPGDPVRYYQFESGIKTLLETGSDSLPAQHSLELKYHQNGTEEMLWISNGFEFYPTRHHKILNAVRAAWTYEKFDSTQPFSTSVKADVWGDFARMSANYEYDYNYEPKRWFTFRAFAGVYFFHDSVFAQNNDARIGPNMPGWKTDIFYDGWFIGRNVYDAVYRMQGMPGPGSLYSISPVGQSWNWTLAVSGSVSMPFDLPLRIYAAAGISPDPLKANKPFGIFEGGLLITTPHKFFEIAFPLVHDKSSKDALLLNTDKYWQRIRFIINFDRINPHTWLDNPHRRKQLHLI
mgnify:CR=1 FL=1